MIIVKKTAIKSMKKSSFLRFWQKKSKHVLSREKMHKTELSYHQLGGKYKCSRQSCGWKFHHGTRLMMMMIIIIMINSAIGKT